MSLKQIGLVSLSFALLVGCKHQGAEQEKAVSTGEKAMATTVPTSMTARAKAREAAMPTTAPAVMKKMATAKIGPSKMATTQPTNKNVTGTVTFTEAGGSLQVVINLKGFEPNSTHGIHLHENGNLASNDFSSAGNHYDPASTKTHGDPAHAEHGIHAGDLGNITADAKGVVRVTRTVANLTIDGPSNSILGKSVIIHAKTDDLKTQPSGNSGGRIAGGVIEPRMQK